MCPAFQVSDVALSEGTPESALIFEFTVPGLVKAGGGYQLHGSDFLLHSPC